MKFEFLPIDEEHEEENGICFAATTRTKYLR